MKQADFERLFNAAYDDVCSDPVSLLGLPNKIDKQRLLKEYFPFKRSRIPNCKKHIAVIIFYDEDSFVCSKCWRRIQGTRVLNKNVDFEAVISQLKPAFLTPVPCPFKP